MEVPSDTGRWVIVRHPISDFDFDGGGREGYSMDGTEYSVFDLTLDASSPVRQVQFRSYVSCGGSSGRRDGQVVWVADPAEKSAIIRIDGKEEVLGPL
eukprot:COSAG01_NODE_6577_length_3598_cov_9.061732_1_plen_98_part_00